MRYGDQAGMGRGKGIRSSRIRTASISPAIKRIKRKISTVFSVYCPLYALGDKCGGNFQYLASGYKDCSGCLIPHRRENYGRILEKYPQIADLAKQNRTKDEEK